MLTITIKQGKEKRLLAGDLLIYATAIERVDGRPQEKNKPGATAVVQTSARQFLARAAYNPKSEVVARVWSYKEDEPVDHAMIKRRVRAAVAKRAAAVRAAAPTDIVPVIRGDQDGLPGLLVDSWGGTAGYLICQFQSAGVDAWKVPIVQALLADTGCPNVYERCDELIRKSEGLPVFYRALAGEEPPEHVLVTEKGQRFSMDLRTGFKYPRLRD
ncbi:SAM-dependent methyltransferase [Duganella sp. FT50W]|uniref:SAM-dependent methyltransferase n=1 Tax=Duganella lactea TaxID=2692173 RepID=A0A6L8MJB3_9BURK|nr:SAM-dependent methyltransferase [Duganella lactea]MYM37103.1 SAM-dependent methyltransferase [Duganella lactea]MYM83240.1 SAM-dependent methyltransferase [Duganella lactea]